MPYLKNKVTVAGQPGLLSSLINTIYVHSQSLSASISECPRFLQGSVFCQNKKGQSKQVYF